MICIIDCKQSQEFYMKSSVLVKIAEVILQKKKKHFCQMLPTEVPPEVFNKYRKHAIIVSAFLYLPILNKYTCCANKWSDFIELVVISLNFDWSALIPVNFDQSVSII